MQEISFVHFICKPVEQFELARPVLDEQIRLKNDIVKNVIVAESLVIIYVNPYASWILDGMGIRRGFAIACLEDCNLRQ